MNSFTVLSSFIVSALIITQMSDRHCTVNATEEWLRYCFRKEPWWEGLRLEGCPSRSGPGPAGSSRIGHPGGNRVSIQNDPLETCAGLYGLHGWHGWYSEYGQTTRATMTHLGHLLVEARKSAQCSDSTTHESQHRPNIHPCCGGNNKWIKTSGS